MRFLRDDPAAAKPWRDLASTGLQELFRRCEGGGEALQW